MRNRTLGFEEERGLQYRKHSENANQEEGLNNSITFLKCVSMCVSVFSFATTLMK